MAHIEQNPKKTTLAASFRWKLMWIVFYCSSTIRTSVSLLPLVRSSSARVSSRGISLTAIRRPLEKIHHHFFSTLFSTSMKRAMPSARENYDDYDYEEDEDKICREWDDGKKEAEEFCLLPWVRKKHKGSSGRVAVLGGSARYTGAPFYAATAALRSGSDLATVYTAEEAALPIKCYSPELMVQSVYSASEFDRISAAIADETSTSTAQQKDANQETERMMIQKMVDTVTEDLDRIHCLVVGPGMGRCPVVMKAVAAIITEARKQNVYLVLDADALFLLAQPQYRNLLKDYDRAVLTPNAMEYDRLLNAAKNNKDDDPFQSVIIVKKDMFDHIRVNGTTLLVCVEAGGGKRAGGIGDVLAGTLSTLVAWQGIRQHRQHATNLPLACWTACCLVRSATHLAFRLKESAMSATDVLDQLGPAVKEKLIKYF